MLNIFKIDSRVERSFHTVLVSSLSNQMTYKVMTSQIVKCLATANVNESRLSKAWGKSKEI